MIEFKHSDDYEITNIEFKSITSILSTIGGFKSAIFSILTLLAPCFFHIFIQKLAEYIKDKDQSQEDTEKIKQKIKERISYYGLYKIYDRLDG
jgi:hypothetical protein